MSKKYISSKTSSQNVRGVRSISRAITVLKSVARPNENGFRLSDIAQDTRLSPSTVHRILSILVAEGLVTQDHVLKSYHLGFELYRLGITAHQFAIRDHFRAALEKIERETQDTVFLVIRSQYDSLCIDRVEGRYPIRTIHVEIGSRRPLGIGASGLALLAFLPFEECETILAANEPRYRYYDGVTGDVIRKLVAKVRKKGYGVSDGLFIEGVTSVGVPIFDDKKNAVAGISVSAITKRMSHRRREDICKLVKEITKNQMFK